MILKRNDRLKQEISEAKMENQKRNELIVTLKNEIEDKDQQIEMKDDRVAVLEAELDSAKMRTMNSKKVALQKMRRTDMFLHNFYFFEEEDMI